MDTSALREALDAFDPGQEFDANENTAVFSYLKTYRLNFPESICRYHSLGTVKSDPYTVVAHYWQNTQQPSAGTVFVIHGYFDHVGLFSKIIRHLLQSGYDIVAFDLPGHGLSTGEEASINHFSEYNDALSAVANACAALPKPWHCLGQSTGGAVLLRSIATQAVQFDHCVLLAPLIKPWRWGSGIWAYRLLSPFIKSLPRKYSDNSHDLAFVDFCKRDPLQGTRLKVRWVRAMKQWIEEFASFASNPKPLLLFQGDEDTTVDGEDNPRIIKGTFPNTQIISLTGARHHLVNEADATREPLFEQIVKYLASPATADYDKSAP
jgi:lysophospholipase